MSSLIKNNNVFLSALLADYQELRDFMKPTVTGGKIFVSRSSIIGLKIRGFGDGRMHMRLNILKASSGAERYSKSLEAERGSRTFSG